MHGRGFEHGEVSANKVRLTLLFTSSADYDPGVTDFVQHCQEYQIRSRRDTRSDQKPGSDQCHALISIRWSDQAWCSRDLIYPASPIAFHWPAHGWCFPTINRLVVEAGKAVPGRYWCPCATQPAAAHSADSKPRTATPLRPLGSGSRDR